MSPRSSRSAALALAVALLVTALPASALAAAGDLDPTFGDGGKLTTDFFGHFDGAADAALQPDGKIVAVGFAQKSSADSSSDVALARYLPDGSLDPDFGDGGLVVTDFGGREDSASAVAIQADGKIVVGGYTTRSNSDFAIVRYLADGSLDTDFGTGGKTTVDFASHEDFVDAVALLPDGKILLGGTTLSDAGGNFALARVDADGALDTSFGTGGKTTTDFFGGDDFVSDVVVQSDGAIVAVGDSFDEDFDDRGVLARYTPDGVLDASFGDGGRVRTELGGDFTFFTVVALQPDGKIVAGGAGGADDLDFALARYETDGTLDPTFGSGGVALTDFSGDYDGVSGLALKPDGRILATGDALVFDDESNITGGYAEVAQYLADGSLDPKFGDGGKVVVDYFGGPSSAPGALLQPDGYLVIVGYTETATGDEDFALARLDARPEPDYTLSLDAPTLTVSRKDKGEIVVKVDRVGGFDGNVTVTAPDTKAIKVKLKPAEASTTGESVTFSYKVKKTASPGSYPLELTGLDDMGRERDVTLTLIIQ